MRVAFCSSGSRRVGQVLVWVAKSTPSLQALKVSEDRRMPPQQVGGHIFDGDQVRFVPFPASVGGMPTWI